MIQFATPPNGNGDRQDPVSAILAANLANNQQAAATKAEIRRAIEVIHPDPGGIIEIRALGVPPASGKGRPFVASGYYDRDHFDQAAIDAYNYSEDRKAAGVYLSLNPPNPALLARAPNRMVDYAEQATTNADILRRRWLMIDLDPHRPAGVPADGAERQAALDLSGAIESRLSADFSFPDPVFVESGNGVYLLYPIDLPNDDESAALVKQFLAGLHAPKLFGTYDPCKPYATIDRAPDKAAQLVRLHGTMNRKGFGTEDRPHRRVEMMFPAEPPEIVPVEAIRQVAALAADESKPKAAATHTATSKPKTGVRIDVPAWIAAHGHCREEKPVANGTAYVLEQCPFDTNHGSNGESAICQAGNGMVTFDCKHNSCRNRTYHDVVAEWGKPPFIGGRTAAAKATKGGEPEEEAETVEPITFDVVTAGEFAAADYRSQFLVKKILVANEPAIIGGRSKTMKTSIMVDLAMSLGTATPFLGKFDVPQPANVLFLSGESGKATIQRTARRVAEAKGVELSKAAVWWGFKLPQIAREDHRLALCEYVLKNAVQVLVVDPAYLCLLSGDTERRQASNIFDMGPLLLSLAEIGQVTQATVILVHHLRKNGMEQDAVPELEDLSMAGFAEFARQWMLLGRREKYQQGTGLHKLWLNVGGSAGHNGCYAVDIDEGTLDDNFDGRKWDVAVNEAQDAREEAKQQRENRKAKEQERQENEHRKRLLDAILRFPEGETGKQLRVFSKLNQENFTVALATLMTEGRVGECKVKKATGTYDGYKPIER